MKHVDKLYILRGENKEMQKQVLHPYITRDRRISKGSPVIVGTRTRVLDRERKERIEVIRNNLAHETAD